jgi:hypothetical protein
VTLEKLERMQKEANERAKQMEQEKEEGEQVHQDHISLEDSLEIFASMFPAGLIFKLLTSPFLR